MTWLLIGVLFISNKIMVKYYLFIIISFFFHSKNTIQTFFFLVFKTFGHQNIIIIIIMYIIANLLSYWVQTRWKYKHLNRFPVSARTVKSVRPYNICTPWKVIISTLQHACFCRDVFTCPVWRIRSFRGAIIHQFIRLVAVVICHNTYRL